MRINHRLVPALLAAGSIVTALAASQAPAPTPAAQAPAVRPPSGPTALAAAAPAGSASIRGKVLAGDTGVPLRRAQVRVVPVGSALGLTAGTDDQGQYEFRNLPSGSYTVTVAKTGYVTLEFGQRRTLDPGRPIELKDAQLADHIDFTLPRGASLQVRVLDDLGEPMADAIVQLLQFGYVRGERQLIVAPWLDVSSIPTSDLGTALIAGVPPGDYYVSARPNAGQPTAVGGVATRRLMTQTYYPGTVSFSEAQRIRLGVGEQASVNIPLAVVRAVSVGGVVRDPSGASAKGLIALEPQQAARVSPGIVATLQPDGRFRMTRVLPGDYRIRLPANAPSAVSTAAAEKQYASVPLTVGSEDIDGLVIATTAGATVSGRLVFDTGQPPAGFQRESFTFGLVPVGLPSPAGNGKLTLRDDWTFQLETLVGRGVLRRSPIAPTQVQAPYLKALVLDGKDVTDTVFDFTSERITNLDIVLADKQAVVSGAVVDGRDAPVKEYVAVLFAADRELRGPRTRYVGVGRADQQGSFRVAGLAPGRYLAAAVPFLENGEEQDPELLIRLEARATAFTLADAESKVVTLRLVP